MRGKNNAMNNITETIPSRTLVTAAALGWTQTHNYQAFSLYNQAESLVVMGLSPATDVPDKVLCEASDIVS